MQRQMELGGATAAGAGRNLRLDPFALPARFAAADPSADGRVRDVEIDRDRVVVQRAVSGIRMRLNVPIDAYLGVAVRLDPGVVPADGRIALILVHRDPALSVTLSASADSDDLIADWQAWGRILGCPLLVGEGDGSWREPFSRIGALVVAAATPRRRRRSAHSKRRPLALLRRKPGRPVSVVHRGEREIIARS